MIYRYRSEVVAALALHGIVPTATTPPARVFDLVNDLYRYELRRLRDRLRAREIPRSEYYDRVVRLRRRYPLVSLPLREWTS